MFARIMTNGIAIPKLMNGMPKRPIQAFPCARAAAA
jgi:hypothetical protein